MKLLVMCPGKLPGGTDDIECFSEVINYYLPKKLNEFAGISILNIPSEDSAALRHIFSTVEVNGYDAIITLGLRFYSKISADTAAVLRQRYSGLICQVHDGSRLDRDPVDITFTFKDDTKRMSANPTWHRRHVGNNEYIGWAADPDLNSPRQSTTDLRILVDHTNYGDNEVDLTKEVLQEVRHFVESNLWKTRYQSVSVRRFDSGKVVDVELSDLSYEKYDRSKTMPLSVISKEHSAAHIFCVTHPESVGLVVLETATAGALVVTPKDFIPVDRLETVRHVEWTESMNWEYIMDSIDTVASRKKALENNWESVAKNIIKGLQKRIQVQEND